MFVIDGMQKCIVSVCVCVCVCVCIGPCLFLCVSASVEVSR